jgi:hypothetical protein
MEFEAGGLAGCTTKSVTQVFEKQNSSALPIPDDMKAIEIGFVAERQDTRSEELLEILEKLASAL